MFQHFFYTLQEFGLKVTLGEWLTLQEALDKGLANSSLTDFYYLILVKSETDFDKFDMAFENEFKSAKYEADITDTMLEWLDKSDLYDQWREEKVHEMNEQGEQVDIAYSPESQRLDGGACAEHEENVENVGADDVAHGH